MLTRVHERVLTISPDPEVEERRQLRGLLWMAFLLAVAVGLHLAAHLHIHLSYE